MNRERFLTLSLLGWMIGWLGACAPTFVEVRMRRVDQARREALEHPGAPQAERLAEAIDQAYVVGAYAGDNWPRIGPDVADAIAILDRAIAASAGDTSTLTAWRARLLTDAGRGDELVPAPICVYPPTTRPDGLLEIGFPSERPDASFMSATPTGNESCRRIPTVPGHIYVGADPRWDELVKPTAVREDGGFLVVDVDTSTPWAMGDTPALVCLRDGEAAAEIVTERPIDGRSWWIDLDLSGWPLHTTERPIRFAFHHVSGGCSYETDGKTTTIDVGPAPSDVEVSLDEIDWRFEVIGDTLLVSGPTQWTDLAAPPCLAGRVTLPATAARVVIRADVQACFELLRWNDQLRRRIPKN